MLNVDGGSQPSDVFGDIIAENHSSHRRLARSTLPHEQDFPLFLALRNVHLDGREEMREEEIKSSSEAKCRIPRAVGVMDSKR